MTLRHLSIFIAVAETGSMSDAARRLFLSQPTVSQVVRELEEHYQVRLFERLGRRLYITEPGRELLTLAYRLTDNYNTLERAMQRQSGTPNLRIGSSITVGTCLIPSVIRDLEAAVPNIDTLSVVGNTREIEGKLLRSELDVAIVEGADSSPELVATPIVEDYLVLACGKNHPFYGRKSISPRELEGLRFAYREKGSGTRKLFEDYLKKHGISVKVSWEANCPRAILNAVLENNALTVMSARLMQSEIESGQLRIFRNETGEWNRSFQLVYHQDKLLTSELRVLEKVLEPYRRLHIPEYATALLTE